MQPLVRTDPVILRYALRGRELAVALPDKDVDALLKVCSYLSNTWNAPGTLLLPVTEDGTFSPGPDDSLSALPPDCVLNHDNATLDGKQRLTERWPGPSRPVGAAGSSMPRSTRGG